MCCAEEARGDPASPCVYMCGNSLGLKPRKADVYMQEQLDMWGSQVGRKIIKHCIVQFTEKMKPHKIVKLRQRHG